MEQQEYIVKLEAMNRQLLDQVTMLSFELREIKQLLFGRRSERFVPQQDTSQLDLALIMHEAAVAPSTVQQKVVVTKIKQSAHQPTGRQPLPANLERKDIVLEPEADTTGMKKIGEEITEQLDYKPGKLIVRRYIRPKYALVAADGISASVIIAPLPSFAIERGIAAPGLLAQIIVDKHADHLPIYRQIKRYQRDGVKLSAGTISGWMDATADLLGLLGKELEKTVLSSGYLQADETPMSVLNGETKGAAHRGYLWAYHSPPLQLVFYDYQTGRGKDGPAGLLKTYSGYLQTDGYGVYEHASIGGRPSITLFHCMAHARRYFDKSLDSDKERASHFLEEVQKLYAVERRCREEALSSDQITALRQQEAIPVLARLKQWLEENYKQVLPKSPIGKAIAYALPRWDRLSVYTVDSRLQIDNNWVENAMRSVALGRKNYMFAGSNEGGKRLALFYSLLESCRKQKINPWEYLTDILQRMPTTKTSQLRNLLPDKWKPETEG